MIKRIAIFGSTGSIGTQALEVIEANPDKFSVEILTANSNETLLVEQAIKYNPNIVVIGDELKYTKVKGALANTSVKVFGGEDALEEVAGPKVRALVRFERDERVAGIVANWPAGATAVRAGRLGLHPHDSFADIIRLYIDDCKAQPNADQTLKGLSL